VNQPKASLRRDQFRDRAAMPIGMDAREDERRRAAAERFDLRRQGRRVIEDMVGAHRLSPGARLRSGGGRDHRQVGQLSCQ
jgi:hypothetical protein